MSDTTTLESGDTGPEDCSLEIACRLNNARAIVDLIGTVCGTCVDGSDSRIDELSANTLSMAMYCIRQEIDAAEEMMPRDAAYHEKQAVRRFAERAKEVIS